MNKTKITKKVVAEKYEKQSEYYNVSQLRQNG